MSSFHHEAGTAIECLSVSKKNKVPSIYFLDFVLIFVYLSQIPITLKKEPEIDSNGQEVLKCGFKIGGGIDQDYQKSPQGYADNVSASVLEVPPSQERCAMWKSQG